MQMGERRITRAARCIVVFVAAPIVMVGTGSAAWASWTAANTTGGGGAVAITTLLAPSSTNASCASGQKSTTITWSDTQTAETGFDIETSTDGGSTWSAASQFTVSGSEPYSKSVSTSGHSFTYHFRIRAQTSSTGGWTSSYTTLAQTVTTDSTGKC